MNILSSIRQTVWNDDQQEGESFTRRLPWSPAFRGSQGDWARGLAAERGLSVESIIDPSIPPMTIPQMFLSCAKEWSHREALAYKSSFHWETYTYNQYYYEVLKAAGGFIKVGLKPQGGVAIYCHNSPAYFICALGAIFAGGVLVAVSYTNVKGTLLHTLTDSEANVVVVDTFKQMNQVYDIWEELPSMKAVVVVTSKGHPMMINNPYIFMWKDFLFLGNDVEPEIISQRIDACRPDGCCAILYGSGQASVTVSPSGVMMSHDNFTYMARVLRDIITPIVKRKNNTAFRIVSYMSLNTAVSLTFELFLPMIMGGLVGFADQDAMRGTLVSTLREVRPHIFAGTARVWILLQKKLLKRTMRLGFVRASMLKWARQGAILNFYHRVVKNKAPVINSPSSRVMYILNKVKRKIGLINAKLFLSFNGSLKLDCLEYYISLDIPVCEMFTSSLLSGPHAINLPNTYQIGSVGYEVADCLSELKWKSEDAGELHCKGRHVCLGILRQPNTDLYDAQGFLNTNVTAYRGKTDCLYISGTTKEVLILNNGVIIAYMPIEKMFKDTLPIISHCMLVGHGKKYPSLLVTLQCDNDPATPKPCSTLNRSVQLWLKQRNTNATTVTDIIRTRNKVVYGAIEDAIITVNMSIRHQSAWIKQFKLLPVDFCLEAGEINPITMTLNREVIKSHYRNEINSLYETPENKGRSIA